MEFTGVCIFNLDAQGLQIFKEFGILDIEGNEAGT
jgi:hypothetical protein